MSEAITRRQFVKGAAAAAGAAALYHGTPRLARAMPRAWAEVPSLPSQKGFILFAAQGYLFALGGTKDFSGVEPNTLIERAPILGPGRLGPWGVPGELPRPLRDFGAALAGDVVYVIAPWLQGPSQEGGFSGQAVLYSRLQGGAFPGPWSEASPLPEAIRGPSAAPVDDFLFVAGSVQVGETPYGTQTRLFRARANPDGSLGPWASLGQVYPSQPAWGWAPLVARGRRFYLLGGGSSRYDDNRVFFADVGAEGEVGPWGLGPPLRQKRHMAAAAFLGDTLYVLGGTYAYPEVGPRLPERSRASGGGDLSPWEAAPDQAASSPQPPVAVASDGLYQVGLIQEGPDLRQSLLFLWDPPFETFFPFIGQGTQAW